jgi:hypothetical protein
MRGRDRSIFTKAGPVTVRTTAGEITTARAYSPVEAERVVAGYHPEWPEADQRFPVRSRGRHVGAEERARRALEKNRLEIEAKRSHG